MLRSPRCLAHGSSLITQGRADGEGHPPAHMRGSRGSQGHPPRQRGPGLSCNGPHVLARALAPRGPLWPQALSLSGVRRRKPGAQVSGTDGARQPPDVTAHPTRGPGPAAPLPALTPTRASLPRGVLRDVQAAGRARGGVYENAPPLLGCPAPSERVGGACGLCRCQARAAGEQGFEPPRRLRL